MEIDASPNHTSARSKVHSLWLVFGFSVAAGALRFAIWSANWITLWYLYGWATVKHDHLRMVRVKPDLVVSNGDVLKGIGAYHYFVGVAVWLPLCFGLLALTFYLFVPQRARAILTEPAGPQASPDAWAVLIVLPLAVLVTAFLTMGAAMILAGGVAFGAILWLRNLEV